MKPKFTPAYDKDMPSPKQRALPDVVQKAILKKKLMALKDKQKVAYRAGVPYMGSKGFGRGTASGVVTASQAHKATRTGGMPGYAKGGPVKKDGYLTDKKGKPYARVHKGERVVPKEKKAFASYMDKVAGANLSPFVLPAAIGAVSAKDSPAKGAAGGVVGGLAGAVAGVAAGLGISAPAVLALARRNPDIAAMIGGASALTGGTVGNLYGAYRGGKHFGSKKTKKASVLSNYMDKVAGHPTLPHSYVDTVNDDYKMLCKSLESLIAQAEHLKMKLNKGLILPSWAEYKIYKAYDAINSANGASYPGQYVMMEVDEAEKEASLKSLKYLFAGKGSKQKQVYDRALKIKQLRQNKKLLAKYKEDPDFMTRAIVGGLNESIMM